MNRTRSILRPARDGNALVLVSALLVMLTLIAAAYLSRTRTQRVTAAAIHDTVADGGRASQIATQLATDVSQHLFLRPIDPNGVGAGIVGGNSNAARRPASAYDARYGVEPSSTYRDPTGLALGRGDMLGDALNPALPLVWNRTTGNNGDAWPDGFNFAPYSVIPWTNWPDHVKPVDLDSGTADINQGRFFPYAADPAALAPATAGSLANNPLGNPGFGDTRWLRSTEPVRMTLWRDPLVTATTPLPTVPDGAFFSHWAHLSFPANANNGWRLVPDIGDIEGHAKRATEATGTQYQNSTSNSFLGGALSGTMNTDRDGLGVPYEQWLATRRPAPIPTAAGAKPLDQDATFATSFAARRNLWFNRSEYLKTMGSGTAAEVGNPNRMLPNLFKLDDPLGVGRSMWPGAPAVPASDEFVDGSPRNLVSRTFCDADGDGWTDSFWFLVPAGQEKNVRTVVGVSIVDNAGMVDVNVATRADRHTTIGFTPADLALVTSEPEGADTGGLERSVMNELRAAPWTDTRVGLFDNPRNFVRGDITENWVPGGPPPKDPRVGGNPAGGDPNWYYNSTLKVEFDQAFDPYRWAGRPTPQLPRLTRAPWDQANGLQPDQDSGEPTFLGSLGLWYDTGDVKKNFWNGYLHLAPRSGARDPIDSSRLSADVAEFARTRRLASGITTPRPDTGWMNARSTVYEGPWRAASPPGTPARWLQSEPMFATATGRSSSANTFSDPTKWRWESWFDAGFNSLDSAPSTLGFYPGSPFMRPEERARWFRHAVSGELRAYAPFAFGRDPADVIDASVLLTPSATAQREFQGLGVRVRPFDSADEIELRAFGGLNDPSNMSRLERSLNGDSLNRDQNTIFDTLLRSSVVRGESGRAGMQLTNAQWVKDLRRKITTVSGQRNDLMPAYLWVGRQFLANTQVANDNERFQSATLWLDLHPQVPGPVDEDGDGKISSSELTWGSYDLMRVSTSDDPFPDGVKIGLNPPVLSPSDWSRGVSIFEHLNRKFDLRRPLVIQRRINPYGVEVVPADRSTRPFLSELGLIDGEGRPREAYAYSAQEQRRAMLDFAVEVRQRLRPALRSYSPQRQLTAQANPFEATLFALGPRQAKGTNSTPNVSYASYTDRFLDQLRLTFSAKVAGAVPLSNRGKTLRGDQRSLANLSELAWRSAWSTEALAASMAANFATWRSRPDLIRESSSFFSGGGTTTPLRPVWQPILPWFESGAYSTKPMANPYFSNANTPKVDPLGVGFASVSHRPDYGDLPAFGNDTSRMMNDWAWAQSIRAVDPSRPDGDPDVDIFGSPVMHNSSVPKKDPPNPGEDTADLVFPGNEKHPFLTECFFGWVYPATTVDNVGLIRLPQRPDVAYMGAGGTISKVEPATPAPSGTGYDPAELPALQEVKLVAVVNGQVGRPRLVPDPTYRDLSPTPNPANQRLIPTAKAQDGSRGFVDLATRTWTVEDEADRKRDELNEIRTPVVVVQVANPWNEPIRLGDFRLNIFGHLYDFPDFEIDSRGDPVLDAVGRPVPLMLPAATELQPATATVYLIANEVGNKGNVVLDLATKIGTERQFEADLSDTAMWDPLFRRRWLDYFDLYEYSDFEHNESAAVRGLLLEDYCNGKSPSWDPPDTDRVSARVTTTGRVPIDRATSPLTSCLFSQPSAPTDGSERSIEAFNRLPRSKLLNAMDISDDNLRTNRAKPCSDRVRTNTKNRITDMWRFKNSLTPDALRRGVTLERILRDPSGRNGDLQPPAAGGTSNWPLIAVADTTASAGGFQRSAASPIESTIDRYRLTFWPLQDLRSGAGGPARQVFPRDSRDPASLFPPQESVVQPNQRPTVEVTTLIVDRFDADDDFNHWSTVSNGELRFESKRLDEDPIATVPANRDLHVGKPAARPDNRTQRFFENPFLNQDRSLVTGGRFWTACAQITLPPTRQRWPDGRDRRMADIEGLDPNKFGAADDLAKDAYWLQLQHLPSLPVMLGSTMMVSGTRPEVTVADFLSRIPFVASIATGGAKQFDLLGKGYSESAFVAEFDKTPKDGVLNSVELAAICGSFPLLDRDANGIPDELQKIFVGFDEPEGNLASFPPPTARSLVSELSALPVPPGISGNLVGKGFQFFRKSGWAVTFTPRPALPPVQDMVTQSSYAGDRSLPFDQLAIPGIMLRTGSESRDYFTSWTRVARSWARNFDATLATRVPPALQDLPRNGRPFDCDNLSSTWNRLQKPGSLLARQEDGAAGATGRVTPRNATYPDPTGGLVNAQNPRLQWNEAVNRPMWEWERQIVNTSTNQSRQGYAFEPGRTGLAEGDLSYDSSATANDDDGNVKAAGGNLSARYGAFAPDRLAPRFVFASRTEPDRCDRPVDMRSTTGTGVGQPALKSSERRGDSRPVRQELLGYQCGRYLANEANQPVKDASPGRPASVRVGAETVAHEGALIYRAPKWDPSGAISTDPFTEITADSPIGRSTWPTVQRLAFANDGEYLTALGDLFAKDTIGVTPRDPDGWRPLPIRGNGSGNVAGRDLMWMNSRIEFNWLTSPVVAPLPDLIGLGWSNDMPTAPDAAQGLSYDAFPELIVRKPSAFNCQTVVDDRLSRDVPTLPFVGSVQDFYKSEPKPYRRLLYAKYDSFILDDKYEQVSDAVTRFVYPPWARPVAPPGEFLMSPAAAATADADPLTQRAAYSLRPRPAADQPMSGDADQTRKQLGIDLYPFSGAGGSVLSMYRVYMGDKGGRLVDHQGKRLVLDRATLRPALHNGDIVADADATFDCTAPKPAYAMFNMQKGINADQWLMQGVWNTIDRMPHGGSLQMLHKDDDFEQLGEITDVFLWGPAYRVARNPRTTDTGSAPQWADRGGWLQQTDLQTTLRYADQSQPSKNQADPAQPRGNDLLIPPRLLSQCRATFAEIMTGRVPGFPVGEGTMVNRLQVDPPNIAFEQPLGVDPYSTASNWGRPQQMGGVSGLRTPYGPNVPWGMRVFDAFVLDGAGGVLRYDWSDQFAGQTAELTAAGDGTLGLPANASDRTNVRAFEDVDGNAGNQLFDPLAQDGRPVAPSGFASRPRFAAARPAGALVPQDMYRDSYGGRDNRGFLWRNPPFTRATFAQWEQDRSPSLAGSYRGMSVPGMLNVNTAPVEVLRTMPHMTQVVYDDNGRFRAAGSPNYELHAMRDAAPFKDLLGGGLASSSGRSALATDGWFEKYSTAGDRGQNPVSKLPESIVLYRDMLSPNPLISRQAGDWFTRNPLDPNAPAIGGKWLKRTASALGTADFTLSTPVYPTYADRGEWAAPGALTATPAQQQLSAVGSGDLSRSETPNPFAFVYFNRGMRASAGVETIGEILGMSRTTRTRLKSGQLLPEFLPYKTLGPGTLDAFPDWEYDKSWSAQFAGMDPYRFTRVNTAYGQGYQSFVSDWEGQVGNDPLDARLSTDRQGVRTFDFTRQDLYQPDGTPTADGKPDFSVANSFHVEPDPVAGDSEERNLLFKGISNIVSTRSDVFTAYFRVRTVRQGPDGRWNAMDPEAILSDTRYVMCIDRSKVNRPTDKPRIVYFTQVND